MDVRDYGQEVVRDARKGLPFDSEKFDRVDACHFLEHLAPGEELLFVISEIHRVLKPGGSLVAIVPHVSSEGAFRPTHKSFWNEEFVEALAADIYQKEEGWRFRVLGAKRGGPNLFFSLQKTRNPGN